MGKPPGVIDKGRWNDAGVWDDSAKWIDSVEETAGDDATLLTEDGVHLLTEDGRPLEVEAPPVFTELPTILVEAEPAFSSSQWTGRKTLRQQALSIRLLAPVALREIDNLISTLGPARFNDKPTLDALELLRELHRQLAELLESIDSEIDSDARISRLDKLRQRMMHALMEGTKLTLLLPAATLGVTQLLALISKTEVDLQSMATIYVALLGHDGWKAYLAAGSSVGSSKQG